MARPLRIHFEDAFYHVMNRGRGRQRIFQYPADYQAFLDTLADHLSVGSFLSPRVLVV